MTIPDFQSIMLPLLKFIGDGQEHNNHEIADALALQLGLTDEEREEMLPSGRHRPGSATGRLGPRRI